MRKTVESIAAFCSIISLAFATTIPSYIRYIIAIVGITSLIFLLYDGYKSASVNELICTSYDEIKDCMKRIIKMQGKICIMSRDLSWVDPEVEACIVSKASSVSIFAEKETTITSRLASQGVTIKYYGDFGFQPKTRFTAIRYNTDNPQVAIANTQESIRKKSKVRHIIHQTVKGNRQDEWINSLATDMISLCENICKEEVYESNNTK